MENHNTQIENDMDSDIELSEFDSSISEDLRRNCKLYNFRRPDKFSKEHLKALQDIHRDFARHLATVLTAQLRIEVEIDVISVDQLTYEEYICSIPNHVQNMVFKLNPLSGEIMLGISPEILYVVIDRMLGGAGVSNHVQKDLTQIEELLTIKFAERMIKILEEAWKTILPIQSEFISLASGFHSAPITASGEIVTLISFEMRLGQKTFGLMNICFPYPVLEIVLPKLTPQYIYQHTSVSANEIGKNEMLEKIKSAKLDFSVILGNAQIEINEILDLKVDDIIKLDQKLCDNLVACVNKKKKFFVTPGTFDNKVCVKLVEQYQQKE